MAQSGFSVTGIDIDGSKVESVNAGNSYGLDVRDESLRPALRNGTIRATRSFPAVESVDTISICFPIPLRKTKDPDLPYIMAAVEAMSNQQQSRRGFIKKAAYVTPAILTLTAVPSFVSAGSGWNHQPSSLHFATRNVSVRTLAGADFCRGSAG